MVRVAFGSLLALGLLGTFLFIISALVFWFGDLYDAFGLGGLLVLEALLFVVSWRISPWISDLLYQWFYKLRWLSFEELQNKDERLAAFLKETCEKEKISFPKIGFIDDNNPQAFTYGSDHWNARMVLTQGIFAYLDKEERRAVAAHELGHIVHRDFIVMTLAAYILTVLYTVGRTFVRMRGRRNPLPLVGAVSLLFYYIGTYVLLYLSRAREYWADEYAKEKMGSGNPLASALVKIAYGIVASKDSEKTKELMEGTRTLGIYDHKFSKTFGLTGADYVDNKDTSAVERAMVYDLNNWWAFWLEISSSHPLTGKRIRALLERESKPIFDMEAVRRFPFDKARHLKEFVVDWTVSKLWIFFAILSIIGALGMANDSNGKLFLAAPLLGAGVGLLVLAFYKYPGGEAQKTSVDELMGDPYASPVRGKPSALEGTLVGRGVPGYVFSEDFMLQDKSGLLYIDYKSWLPFLGDLFFSITRAGKLVGSPASCKGWFFRGASQHLALDYMLLGSERITSRPKSLAVIMALVPMAIGIWLML